MDLEVIKKATSEQSIRLVKQYTSKEITLKDLRVDLADIWLLAWGRAEKEG